MKNGKQLMLWTLIAAFLFVLLPVPSAEAETAVPRETIRYDANGGVSEAFGTTIDRRIARTHLRENTLPGVSYFTREGFVLTGWNTLADGSGTHIGLGSRISFSEGMTLYAEWAKATDEQFFTFSDGTVSSYNGAGKVVVVPETIGGEAVRRIAAGTFRELVLNTLILPSSLETVEDGAFTNCSIEMLTLFDRVGTVSDASFSDCRVQTLRINAACLPVYSGSYFGTFSDKYDYLLTLADCKKLVLFSGSSGRYGYDSAAIESAFPAYRVVNMGVYAYTNALPQYELIRALMTKGDMLLVAPEFDAVTEQFCVTNRLDPGFWAMMESNYDAAAALDLTHYTAVFDSFAAYQRVRAGMETHGYEESPWAYDDDGNRYAFATYNVQGDFILPRPNSERDELHRHNIADYTTETVTPEAADALDRVLRAFLSGGISVFVTYAPRNRSSLTERSTAEARSEVHRLLCDRLSVPVISELEDSLYSGVYFWNIDNHLSTEGVKLRTEQVIHDLNTALYGEPAVSAEKTIRIPYPVALGLYVLALLLLVAGVWIRRSWTGYAAGFVWVAATVTALLYGAPLYVLLLCTLPLALASILSEKRGECA